jgi:hypothetical protein
LKKPRLPGVAADGLHTLVNRTEKSENLVSMPSNLTSRTLRVTVHFVTEQKNLQR